MAIASMPAVVLVEDTPNDELMSVRGIQGSGVLCEVIVRRDGPEALAYLLDDAAPVPDLVVLDFRLPGLNGLEILRRLRAHDRTRLVPVVILSGNAGGVAVEQCYINGANSCVSKPTDSTRYLEHVGLIVRYWLTVNIAP